MNKWEELYSNILTEIDCYSFFLSENPEDKIRHGIVMALTAVKERMDDLKDERQEGCKYCTEYADLPEYVEGGEPHGRVFDTGIEYDDFDGLGWFITGPWEVDIGIKFCPYCGRELPEVEDDKTSL